MQIELKGEFTGIREMRKHIAWYTAGMKHSAGLRRDSNLVSSYEELGKIAGFSRLIADFQPFLSLTRHIDFGIIQEL